jgi:hypothetical protein
MFPQLSTMLPFDTVGTDAMTCTDGRDERDSKIVPTLLRTVKCCGQFKNGTKTIKKLPDNDNTFMAWSAYVCMRECVRACGHKGACSFAGQTSTDRQNAQVVCDRRWQHRCARKPTHCRRLRCEAGQRTPIDPATHPLRIRAHPPGNHAHMRAHKYTHRGGVAHTNHLTTYRPTDDSSASSACGASSSSSSNGICRRRRGPWTRMSACHNCWHKRNTRQTVNTMRILSTGC